MIFQSYMIGDKYHDRVIQGFLDGEIKLCTLDAIYDFLKKEFGAEATLNKANKVHKKVEKQIVNRRLTYNKVAQVITSTIPTGGISKDDLCLVAGFRRKPLYMYELNEILNELKIINPEGYATLIRFVHD